MDKLLFQGRLEPVFEEGVFKQIGVCIVKLKCIYFAFIIYCISLCACPALQKGEQGEKFSAQKEMSAKQETVSTEPETEPEPQDTAEEFYYRTKQGLVFGKLFLALSKDVQVESISTAAESYAVRLWQEDGRLVPAEMYLYRFTADREADEGLNALIESLMDLAEVNVLQLMGWNPDTGELFLRAEDGSIRYSILVRGQEVYLVKEHTLHERELNFQANKVHWTDTGKNPVNTDSFTYYFKVEEPDDKVYLIEVENGAALVYRGEYPEVPIQELTDEGIAYRVFCPYPADIDFDGCPDLLFDGCAYLYDASAEEFVKAGLPAKMYNDSTQNLNWRDTKLFVEEKAIWGEVSHYGEERWDGEYLWQWEGNTLVQRREIRLERGEDEVRLFARDEKKGVLFDITLKREKYELDPVALKPYYEQFYEGYLSTDAYYINHIETEAAQSVPEELTAFFEQALIQGREREVLASLENGRVPSDEEIRDIAYANEELYMEIRDTLGGNFILVDGDNDGVEDLLADFHWPGSGGFSELIFYRGQGNGSFLPTDSDTHQIEKYFSFAWEGQPYLCMLTYDYYKFDYDGLGILYYENGMLREVNRLRLLPNDYTYQMIQYADSDYQKWAEALFTPKLCEGIYALTEVEKNVKGGAEEETDDAYEYVCDLNNDGTAEHYTKIIATAYVGERYLSFECEEAPEISTIVWSIEGSHTPIMLWAEEFSGKNIVNVMYRTGLYDYLIVGYLIEGDEYTQVFCLQANASYKTERNYYRFYAGYEELEYYGDGWRF